MMQSKFNFNNFARVCPILSSTGCWWQPQVATANLVNYWHLAQPHFVKTSIYVFILSMFIVLLSFIFWFSFQLSRSQVIGDRLQFSPLLNYNWNLCICVRNWQLYIILSFWTGIHPNIETALSSSSAVLYWLNYGTFVPTYFLYLSALIAKSIKTNTRNPKYNNILPTYTGTCHRRNKTNKRCTHGRWGGQDELWNFRYHVLSLPGAKVP